MDDRIQISKEVILCYQPNRPSETEMMNGIITKIGRKYFTVKNSYDQEIQFEKSSCKEKDTGYGYGYNYILYFSQQEIDNEKEHNDLSENIRKLIGKYGKIDLTLDQLRQIYNIMQKTP